MCHHSKYKGAVFGTHGLLLTQDEGQEFLSNVRESF